MNENLGTVKQDFKLTTGQFIKEQRDLKGWTQEELALRSKISATNISRLERDRAPIGKKRAELLGQAFGIHPAIIMFPDFEPKFSGSNIESQ